MFNVPLKNIQLISAQTMCVLTVLSMVESMGTRGTEPDQLQQEVGVEPGPPEYKSNALSPELSRALADCDPVHEWIALGTFLP